MKIVIASDHAGFELKKYIIENIDKNSYQIEDMGNTEFDINDDYPDYIKKVAEFISENDNTDEYRGIIIGGSGQGENIVANKYKNIRSVVIYGNDADLNTEIVKLSRDHNNANIISFGARFITNENALNLLNIWLKKEFSNEERHIRRLSKINID